MAEERVSKLSYVEQWAKDHGKTGTPSEEKMDILPQEENVQKDAPKETADQKPAAKQGQKKK